jgi:ParB/RepB/Spo0J family partition protein
MTMTTEYATAAGNLQFIPPSALTPNPANPRKTFDQDALEELAASIRSVGVLQPVVARPLPDGTLQLVAGERRWRASMLAGLEALPCIVRPLTDQDALEIAVLENLQRKDVPAIEEAAGLRALIDSGAFTPDTLAEKIGKSRSHVYERLRLLTLSPIVTQAIDDGYIEASSALLVSKLPPPMQARLVADMKESPFEFDIEHTLAPNLKKAVWKLDDDSLLPSAGACSTCPKLSGNAPDLKAEFGNAHTCTDRQCYRAKMDAFREDALDKACAKTKTATRLTWEGHGKVFKSAYDDAPRWDSGYEIAADEDYQHLGGKTWQAMLAELPDVPIGVLVMAVNPTGKVLTLVRVSEALAALTNAGLIKAKPGRVDRDAPKDRATLIKDGKLRRAGLQAVYEALRTAAAEATADAFFATYMVFRLGQIPSRTLLEHLGSSDHNALPDVVMTTQGSKLRQLALASFCEEGSGELNGYQLLQWAERLGVNFEAIDKAARNAAASEMKAPKATKATKTKATKAA